MNNVTIVSGFVSNVNDFRSLEKYIICGKKLLNNKINKIIFMEEDIYEKYLSEDLYENTHFIKITKNDIYLFEHKNKITNFSLVTKNTSKDTIDYMFVMCNKTEWIRKAIELNIFNAEQFVWVDFGIFHIFGDNDSLFNESLSKLENNLYEKVRIASCWILDRDIEYYSNYFGWDKNIPISENRFNYINWYFLGGVFGGNVNYLLRFADLMKEKCISLIEKNKTICWEVNLWYLIYQENKELFDAYYADHNPSILLNY